MARQEFLALNHGGTVPVLMDEDGTVVSESAAIVEYIEEVYPETSLLEGTAAERAEIRRLMLWFDLKFDAEVTSHIIFEKIVKRLMRAGEPDMDVIRCGLENIAYHLDYISYLGEQRRWLAGERFSYADITAAAHLSALDYTGDVPWAHFPQAKDWYARVKSRPSFRSILGDFIPGMPPPRIYADLDF